MNGSVSLFGTRNCGVHGSYQALFAFLILSCFHQEIFDEISQATCMVMQHSTARR